MTDNSLRARYEREYPRLEQHAAALLASLRDAFREDERIVLIEARAKKIVSFLRKAEGLENGGEPKYPVPLTDIQDQIGCRIVVRSPRDVAEVIATLQQNYNSIENQPRPARLDPATFGYEAWHLVCLLPPRRDTRVETQTFEIQISTPFQYAWTVMEHDLLYKPGGAPPTYEQRRLVYAAAALAFAADQLFESAQAGAATAGPTAPAARSPAPPRPRAPRSPASGRRLRGAAKRRSAR